VTHRRSDRATCRRIERRPSPDRASIGDG
jgi:hypothetical protein